MGTVMADGIRGIETSLRAHAQSERGLIRDRFESEPERMTLLRLKFAGIRLDLSRLDLDRAALALLVQLADAADLRGAQARLAGGEIVNPSEGRAATHMAERGVGDAALVAAAGRRDAAMLAVLEELRMHDIRHVIQIGIGGSALGPALLIDALGRDGDGPAVEIVSNVDGEALRRAYERCEPTQTMLVVISKTFSTAETMTNAASALQWFAAAGVERPLTVAVTAAPDRALHWMENAGCVGHVLEFAKSVGGRYSLWSAVGLAFALRCGTDEWADLKAGAAAMDRHFLQTPWLDNAPVLAAMGDLWAHRFLGQSVRGVFAYDERLRLLPCYLQQLEMESNGKRVSTSGALIRGMTAPVTWGGTGTDAQHAVFQLLHQGTVLGPVEFLAVREASHGLAASHHRQLLANCLAQGAALLRGRGHDDPARVFPGNRPSSTILLDRLDARTLGALLAFYEHRTFANAVMMGINPFDQWGVELGKSIAADVLAGALDGMDPSTIALVREALPDENMDS